MCIYIYIVARGRGAVCTKVIDMSSRCISIYVVEEVGEQRV
jgi:hypothetical protein